MGKNVCLQQRAIIREIENRIQREIGDWEKNKLFYKNGRGYKGSSMRMGSETVLTLTCQCPILKA